MRTKRPMRTRLLGVAAALVAAALIVAACGGDDDDAPTANDTEVADCGTLTVAVIDDDSHHAGLWAIENDEVTSDVIDLDISYLQIPGLIQATGTGQYDVVQTALGGVALARAAGADVQIVYLGITHAGGGMRTYVPADSDIQTPADLDGATVGIVSLGSTAALQASYVYQDSYGVDASPEGGDVRWTELDPPTLLNAVQTGQVDAAVMWHLAGWSAENDEDLRPIDHADDEYLELYGERAVGSTYTATGDQLEGREHCYNELQRMLDESGAYAEENISEIAPEVSEVSGVPTEFIEYWWGGAYEFGGIDEVWINRAQVFYDQAIEHESIPEAPDLDEIVLEPQS